MTLHSAKSDDMQDSETQGGRNCLNKRDKNNYKTKATSRSNTSGVKSYKLNKEGRLKVNTFSSSAYLNTKTSKQREDEFMENVCDCGESLDDNDISDQRICHQTFTSASNLGSHVEIVCLKPTDHTCDTRCKSFAYKCHLQKHSSECKKIEDEREPKVSSNKVIDNEEYTLISKDSVETVTTDVRSGLNTETNNHTGDDYREHIGAISDKIDEREVLNKSICSGNIDCGCNGCEAFRENLLNRKCKPKQNYKHNCDLCGRTFPRKSLLKEHKATKCNTLKVYSCDYCAIGFTSLRLVKRHLKKNHSPSANVEKHHCDLCDKYYSSRSILNRHKRNLHFGCKLQNLTYKCDMCQKMYSYKQGLDRHKKDIHSDDNFECGHCSKIYPSKNKLQKHIQYVHIETLIKECGWPGCRQTFTSALGLGNHVKVVHLKPTDHTCDTCGKGFAYKGHLQKHLSICKKIEDERKPKISGNKVIDNEECASISKDSVETVTTDERSGLNTETNNHTGDDYREDIGDRSESICSGNIFCGCNGCEAFRENLLNRKCKPKQNYKHNCDLCGRTFPRKCLLKEHKATKCNTLKLYSCDSCTRGFTSLRLVKHHQKNFHSPSGNVEKHHCDLCDKYYLSKQSLYIHKRNAHFGRQLLNLTYKCDMCQKVYSDKKGLDYHKMNIHSDDNFECGHCSKIYCSKSQLRKHIKIVHLQALEECRWPSCHKRFASSKGLKDHELFYHLKSFDHCFICDICGKRSSSKLRLQNHILTHTDEKPYICQVCGKTFRTDSNLHQHSRTHSNKRPFSCDLCPKAFRIKHHLRQHMAVHGMDHTSVMRKQAVVKQSGRG